ncbi:MAG: diguanylate cyclase [Planctomycetota bacterium]
MDSPRRNGLKALKFTTPGILLIAVTLCAGGILMVHHFVLRPYVTAEQRAALRQQAVRSERGARAVLRAQQQVVARTCTSCVEALGVRLVGSDEAGAAAELGRVVRAAGGDMAVVVDSDGGVIRAWFRAQTPEPGASVSETLASIDPGGERAATEGLLELGNDIVVVARRAIPSASDGQAAFLWVGRYMNAAMLEDVSAAAGGPVVRVAGRELREGIRGAASASHALWMADDDTLAVAWALQDIAGRKLGYLRADVAVGPARRQGALAQRNTRIVLALSVGLSGLAIVGVHVLVTGPIIRLLDRVRRLESGEETVRDLTRDLHGEPRILAGRLESTFEKLAVMSKRDQLTGLANRGHFEEVLNAFYHQARRYNRPLSLIMLDIDFFKAINDTGGHGVGDELLKTVAACLERVCRQADLPARLGGDEFAVLLPETPCASAAAMAERVRSEISHAEVTVHGTEANVTASVGIVDLNVGEIDSPDAMLLLADRAMYAAKEGGRNRVCQGHDLDDAGERRGGVDVLSRKLIGLDAQFKDMFVQGIEEIMEILADRDPHMAAHARKVQHYAVLIAGEMELPERVIKRLRIGAMLHDLGMLAMPDSVLLCDGALDEHQLRIMRRHPLLSVRIMEGMEFLEQEIPTVRYHHECFDGSGYPEGLVGAAIPLTARILAVADAFDAMTSPRTFRSARTISEAIGELRGGTGVQFDPAVVEAFIAVAGRVGEDLTDVPLAQRRKRDGVSAPADAR